MKRNIRALSVVTVLCLLLTGCLQPQPEGNTPPGSTPNTTESQSAPTTQATTPNPVVTEPPAEEFVLSFAGDCTFGDNYDVPAGQSTFCSVVGENYAYPLSNVKSYFENDDYSFVNLECALTASDPTEEEMEELKENHFRFRGPVSYAKILTAGGVEFASCANNHSKDYGRQGLYDTWAALAAENVQCASFGKTCLTTTESGLTIGVIAAFFYFGETEIRNQIQGLRDKGAEIVVVSVHWGDEGTYSPNATQQTLGHRAIDAGADIVFGHHSHTLQRIEPYRGGIIYYSLGNFSFGGNRNPSDKDTAIVRQHVLRYEDGTVALGDLEIIPCRVSTSDTWNDYRPTPYEKDHPGYERVFRKLEGSYDGKDLNVSYEPKPETGK